MQKRHFQNCMSKEKKLYEQNSKKYKMLLELAQTNKCSPINKVELGDVNNEEGPSCSSKVITKQGSVAESAAGLREGAAYFAEIIGLLKTISAKVEAIENRLNNEMVTRAEFAAQTSTVREIKVLTKHVAGTLARMTGDVSDPIMDELSALIPLSSTAAILEMEELLEKADYVQAMVSIVLKLKGISNDIDPVVRALFTDEVLHDYNWDGRAEKRAFGDLKIVGKVLCDVFKYLGNREIQHQCRRSIELSRNRNKQRKYCKKNKTKENSLI